MFGKILCCLTFFALSGHTGAAVAADFSDPTWPCIQRKVRNLSLGQMFPYAIPQLVTEDAKLTAEINDLAARLALRRVSLEQADALITAFAPAHFQNPALGQLLVQSFDAIVAQRLAIINGIARYATKQSSLSLLIEQRRHRMKTLLAMTPPNYDQIEALEEKLDWDERIYTDRVRSLRYVCETPVILEQRIFAISKLILAHWQP